MSTYVLLYLQFDSSLTWSCIKLISSSLWSCISISSRRVCKRKLKVASLIVDVLRVYVVDGIVCTNDKLMSWFVHVLRDLGFSRMLSLVHMLFDLFCFQVRGANDAADISRDFPCCDLPFHDFFKAVCVEEFSRCCLELLPVVRKVRCFTTHLSASRLLISGFYLRPAPVQTMRPALNFERGCR